MWARTSLCTSMSTHTYPHARTHPHTDTHRHTHACARTHTRMHTHAHMHVHTHVTQVHAHTLSGAIPPPTHPVGAPYPPMTSMAYPHAMSPGTHPMYGAMPGAHEGYIGAHLSVCALYFGQHWCEVVTHTHTHSHIQTSTHVIFGAELLGRSPFMFTAVNTALSESQH
jgi:hypothetical protein